MTSKSCVNARCMLGPTIRMQWQFRRAHVLNMSPVQRLTTRRDPVGDEYDIAGMASLVYGPQM